MIEWLSEWLRQIILVVLLATFIDLLLPNNQLQKYVKIAISLFILLMILSPIIDLLQQEAKLDVVMSSLSNPSYQVKMKSLQQIRQEGDHLKEIQHQQSMRLVEQHIAEMMTQQLKEQLPNETFEIIVETELVTEEEMANIKSVQVTWLGTTEPLTVRDSRSARHQNAYTPFQPIEPVTIDFDQEQHRKRSQSNPLTGEKARWNQIREQVTRTIMQQWQIPSHSIMLINGQS